MYLHRLKISWSIYSASLSGIYFESYINHKKNGNRKFHLHLQQEQLLESDHLNNVNDEGKLKVSWVESTRSDFKSDHPDQTLSRINRIKLWIGSIRWNSKSDQSGLVLELNRSVLTSESNPTKQWSRVKSTRPTRETKHIGRRDARQDN